MEGLTIARAAEETGFTPSALRFYEGQGLITPARTPAGYRSYDAASIETLRFIARAKRLGLSLEDISDLVALLDDRRCEPVQERLRSLLADKLAEAREQIATLMAFTAQLQQAAARLRTHTPYGPCDIDCGCTTDAPADATVAPVLLTAKPAQRDEVPIACTLGAGEMHQRVADWQEALREVTAREAIDGGVRVHLPGHTPIAQLAALIEAEQTCCQFFTFALTIGVDGVSLDVTGPADAADIVHALLGAPATEGTLSTGSLIPEALTWPPDGADTSARPRPEVKSDGPRRRRRDARRYRQARPREKRRKRTAGLLGCRLDRCRPWTPASGVAGAASRRPAVTASPSGAASPPTAPLRRRQPVRSEGACGSVTHGWRRIGTSEADVNESLGCSRPQSPTQSAGAACAEDRPWASYSAAVSRPLATRGKLMRRSALLAGAVVVLLAILVVTAFVVLRDDGPKAVPLRGQPGGSFAQAPELRSSGGVLDAAFEVADRRTTIAGRQVEGQSYADGVQGPTLRLAPGEVLRIRLRNRLDQPTNLHLHGLHVTPLSPGDNVLMQVEPGQEFTYEVRIPPDHARGTYWYHSHQHGTSEAQVFAGLSGVLIVEGLEDLLPPPLRDVPQRILALKDVQTVGDAVQTKNIDSNAPTTRLVNGLERPQLTVRGGATELWRLANIGADIFYDVQLPGTSFTVIGEDGNPVWEVWSADHLVLPPGKRYDVLVQPAAGSASLTSLAYDQGGDQYPEVALMTVDVSGASVTPAPLPTALVEDPGLSTARIDRSRTVVFDGSDKEGWKIDGKPFDPARIDQLVALDTTEEWTVRNTSAEQHPFHIHQDDFQVMSVNGQAYPARSEQDTVVIPIGGEVVIRMRFTDFPGRWVYHCHILAHEDAGMMGVVGAAGPDGQVPGPVPTLHAGDD